MTNSDIISLTDSHILPTYSRFPVAIERVLGSKAYDFDGKEYIDFTSGIGVNSIGGSNEHWVKAVTEQAKKLAHISNLYYTEPAAILAKRLCEKTGMRAAFFSNSGAEANEGLIKLARKYGRDKYGEGHSTIVTLRDSFHGRTVTTLSATGQDVFHQHFGPFTEGFRHAYVNDLTSVSDAFAPGDVCGILIEPVQGEGGVLPLDIQFIQAIAELCAGHDILLMFDEVQTGIGRTGSLFAFQCCGVKPDAVSFAKGISSGLPFGGFLVGERAFSTLGAGTHATTFGGNPICAAAANAVLDVLTDDVLIEVKQKGELIRSYVKNIGSDRIKAIRGVGLMIGIELLAGESNKAVVSKLHENGLMALTAGHNTVRFLPPLTISWEELESGLKIFKDTITERNI